MRFTVTPADLATLREVPGGWSIEGTDEETGRRWVIVHDAAPLVVAVRDVLAFDHPTTFDVPARQISHRADSDDPPTAAPTRDDRRRLAAFVDPPRHGDGDDNGGPLPRRVVGEQWGMPGEGAE